MPAYKFVGLPPGQTVTVKKADGSTAGTGTVDNDGTLSITLDVGDYSVTTTDYRGRTVTATEELASSFDPEAGAGGTSDASALTGTLNPDRLADASVPPRKLVGQSKVSDLPSFWQTYHRGLGDFTGPMHTMESYRAGVAAGSAVLDLDVYLLPDGSIVCYHDPTVSDTTALTAGAQATGDPTTGAGATVVQSSSSIVRLRVDGRTAWPSYSTLNGSPAWATGTAYKANQLVKAPDLRTLYVAASAHTATTFTADLAAGLWTACPEYPRDFQVPFFREVLAEFGGKTPILVECKNTGSAAAVAAVVKARGMQESVILASFSFAELMAAKAVDSTIPLMYIATAGLSGVTGGNTVANLLAQGVAWLNVNKDNAAWSDANIQAAVAAGARVVPYHVNTLADAAKYKGYGCAGVYTQHGAYLNPARVVQTSETFVTGVPANGYRQTHLGAGFRAPLHPAGGAVFPTGRTATDALLVGPMVPIAGIVPATNAPAGAPATYSLTFTLVFDVLPTDLTRYARMWVCQTGDLALATAANDNGYVIDLTAAGLLRIEKRTAGASSGTVSVTSAALVEGASVQVKVDITATQVRATRVGSGETTVITDSTFRGPFFHIGKVDSSGLAQVRYTGVTRT